MEHSCGMPPGVYGSGGMKTGKTEGEAREELGSCLMGTYRTRHRASGQGPPDRVANQKNKPGSQCIFL